MYAAVLDALVENLEGVELGLALPDPNDNHVLAAALRGHCQAIVTANLSDFPSAYLDGMEIGSGGDIPTDLICSGLRIRRPRLRFRTSSAADTTSGLDRLNPRRVMLAASTITRWSMSLPQTGRNPKTLKRVERGNDWRWSARQARMTS